MLIKTIDFQTKISERYKNVRSSGDFSDVTLVSEDYGRVEAHKVILATASIFFKDLFKTLSHGNPMIFMRGVTANQLNSIMQLIYYGETMVYEDQIEGVLQLMEEMKLDGEKELNRKLPKTKSIMCNFFNRGFCKEGNRCPFNHPKDDCQEHLDGRCHDPWCKKRHRSICKHWLQGSCSLEQDCEFLHNTRMDDRANGNRSRTRNSSRSSSSSSGQGTW